jgi:hypothetical protein
LVCPAGYYNWCLVPGTSYDVVLFGGLAVVLSCLLQGKLNTLMVLAAGECWGCKGMQGLTGMLFKELK